MYISKLFKKYNFTLQSTSIEMNFKKNNPDFESSIKTILDNTNNQRKDLILVNQTHSNIILESPYIKPDTQADGIILKDMSKIAGIKTADCIPLILLDTVLKVAIFLHVGRKGGRDGIVENAFKIFRNCYNSKPENIIAYLGPNLEFNHHIIFEEEMEGFDLKYFIPLPKGTHIIDNQFLYDNYKLNFGYTDETIKTKNSGYFDYKTLIVDKLLAFGLTPENIDDCKIESYNNKQYHSYRRDAPDNGLMLTYGYFESQDS